MLNISIAKAIELESSRQLDDFHRKYQIVLSSCRLLTEAQSALDRSIQDFVAVAEAFQPDLRGSYKIGAQNSTAATIPPADIDEHLDRELPGIEAEVSSDALLEEAHGKKKSVEKKPKKLRDPNMPRKPVGPYFIFQNAVRGSVKADMPPDAKGLDIQKAISEKWKDLSEAARKPYTDQHELDQKAYEARMTAYKKSAEAGTSSLEDTVDSTSRDRPPSSDDDAAAALLVGQDNAETPLIAPPKVVKKRSRKSDAKGPVDPNVPAANGDTAAPQDKKEKKKRKKTVPESSAERS